MRLQKKKWSTQEPFNELLIFFSSKQIFFLYFIWQTYGYSKKTMMSSGYCLFLLITCYFFFLKLFFVFCFCRYPYNNSLHHHVESIALSCLESKTDAIVNHLLRDCDLIGRIIQADKHSVLSSDRNLVHGCFKLINWMLSWSLDFPIFL